MSAPKIPALPTSAEIRAQIDQAQEAFRAAQAALGEALFDQAAGPRDISPERDAVDAAGRRAEELELLLPLVEKRETEALAETRAKLVEEQRKKLSRVLRELLKHSLSFSVHYQNAASAFKRMSAAGNEAARLLSAAQREVAHGGLALRLSSHGLKVLADQEINRIGLLPAHRAEAGEANSPGTNPRVDLNYANAPHRLPGLEAEIRRLTALLLETAPEPQERGSGTDLPQHAPTSSAEAPTANGEENHAG
jgi:hypothetical protein